MTEEPVYNFIKGKGWVASSGYSATATIGKWIVTVEQRTPKRGERYVELYGAHGKAKPSTVEEALELLKDDRFAYCMTSAYVKDYFNIWRKVNDTIDYTDSAVFVISFKKPKVEQPVVPPRAPTLTELLNGHAPPRRRRRGR